jgi:hypothetical protein
LEGGPGRHLGSKGQYGAWVPGEPTSKSALIGSLSSGWGLRVTFWGLREGPRLPLSARAAAPDQASGGAGVCGAAGAAHRDRRRRPGVGTHQETRGRAAGGGLALLRSGAAEPGSCAGSGCRDPKAKPRSDAAARPGLPPGTVTQPARPHLPALGPQPHPILLPQTAQHLFFLKKKKRGSR